MSASFLAALAGALIAAGLLLGVLGLRRRPQTPSRRRLRSGLPRWIVRMPRWQRFAAVAAFAAGWLMTLFGAPMMVVVVLPLAVIGLPVLLVTSDDGRRIAKLDALSAWTRNLAGVVTAGQTVEQALNAAARAVPEAIEPEVMRLAARMRAQTDTETALWQFGAELADATADMVVSTLVIGARHRGDGLPRMLISLAESVAEEVRSRREIEADREKARGGARLITVLSVGGTVLLAFVGDFLSPYGTPVGQLVLAVWAAVFIAGLVWLRRMVSDDPPPRIAIKTEVPR